MVEELLPGVAREWPEVERLRLAVVDTKPAVAGFWARLGFEASGEERPHRYEHPESVTRLFERPVPWEK